MEEHPIRFRDVEIDPARREIRRDGRPVPVQRKVFDLLLYLIAHRERAVSKEEIQEAVWPGVIVTETALTRAVMKARRAVGDDSGNQQVIRTVHGHGYRFVVELPGPAGPVAGAGPDEQEFPPEVAPDAAEAPRGRLPWAQPGWLAIAGSVLAGLVIVAIFLTWNPGVPAGTRVAVLPIDDRSGDAELAWTSLGLMSYANRLIAEGAGSDVVPAGRVVAAAESLPPDPSPEALQALRQSLDASHLVAGRLARVETRLVLAYRVYHGSGAGPEKTVTGADATGLGREMVRGIISSLPGAGLRREFRTVSEDPFVNEAYARGLALQLSGDVAKARDYFEVAVRQEPGLFWPRYELALAMRDMGDLDAARENLEKLAGLADSEANPEMRAAANNALAQVHWRSRDYERAEASYMRALEAARAGGRPGAESTILVNLGILSRITGNLDEARRHLAGALAAGERAGDENRGAIYQSLGQVEYSDGALALAMDYYRRAHEDFLAAGDRRGMAASLNAMARVERRLGHFARAEALMQEALPIREALGDFFGRIASLVSLAELHADMENWGEARAAADRAVNLAREQTEGAALAEALQARAGIAIAGGDSESAREDIRELSESFPDIEESTQFRMLRAGLLLADGEESRARPLLEAVIEAGPDAARIDALDLLASHAADASTARAHWEEALAIAEGLDERGRSGRLLVAMIRRDIADGNGSRARRDLRRLEETFEDWEQLAVLRRQAMATTEGSR